METVFIRGRRHTLTDAALLGEGGEARVYTLDPTTVVKRYKGPDDPSYDMFPEQRPGAKHRLDEQQLKLPAFPSGLPDRVVTPRELAYDSTSGGRIIGYTMDMLADMEVLLQFSDQEYREKGGIDGNRVIAIYRSLHELVRAVHTSGVVIADFNDLNVLVDGKDRAHLVDADSMQFGRFYSRTFTARFLDPLNSGPDKLTLLRPHNQSSDWYAYLVMLCQALLYVGPYGGVHRPKGGKRLQHDARVLRRITFFHPDVTYPKNMPTMGVLPDELLGHMQKVFEHDERGVFPLRLLDSLRWTGCTGCGALHARSVCPQCAAPGVVKERTVVRGQVTATRVFRTDGRILHVVYHGNQLRYLYHHAGVFMREGDGTSDGRKVIDGPLQPDFRYHIQGDTTLLGVGNRLLVFAPDAEPERLSTDAYHGLPVFDANSQHRYWIDGSQLVREDGRGSSYIGDVLQGQTLFWTGRRFGFGYYQAGRLLRCFVFDAERRGINDQVPIKAFPGQIVDATCVFSDDLAWFMVQTQTGGQLINLCYVIDRHGQLVAQTEAQAGDDSWLATGIRGHLAMGKALFAATDEGLVRIVADNGMVEVERSFPDTEPFVSASTQLVPAQQGIYAVSGQEIVLLQIR